MPCRDCEPSSPLPPDDCCAATTSVGQRISDIAEQLAQSDWSGPEELHGQAILLTLTGLLRTTRLRAQKIPATDVVTGTLAAGAENLAVPSAALRPADAPVASRGRRRGQIIILAARRGTNSL